MSLALREKLIFEYSRPGRGARGQWPAAPAIDPADALPQALRRRRRPLLPEVSELDALRHYTRLSQLNFSIDTHFYPLGSCTMKYNPRACNAAAMLPEFLRALKTRGYRIVHVVPAAPAGAIRTPGVTPNPPPIPTDSPCMKPK